MTVYRIAVLFTDKTTASLRHYGNMESAMDVMTDYVKRSVIVADRIWSMSIEREN